MREPEASIGGRRAEAFSDFLAKMEDHQRRARTGEVLRWVLETFPELEPRIAWNQPMFTHHGTFIIGFSAARGHLAAAPEREGIQRFSEEIRRAGYDHSKELVRFRWEQEMDYPLLERIIRFNMEDKAGCPYFWRH